MQFISRTKNQLCHCEYDVVHPIFLIKKGTEYDAFNSIKIGADLMFCENVKMKIQFQIPIDSSQV